MGDFWDHIRELDASRRSAILAQVRLARLGDPEKGDKRERQAFWEQSELARASEASDFPWINSSTVWSLHSALDGFVEDLSPAFRDMTADLISREMFARATAEYPDAAAELEPAALDALRQAATQILADQVKPKRVRGNGVVRWEKPLAHVGLGAPPDRPIPNSLDRALVELCVIRDVLTHRCGRVDDKAAADCPWLGLQVGTFVRISSGQARRYSAAVGTYGAEVVRRVLSRGGIDQRVDLGTWQQGGFLI